MSYLAEISSEWEAVEVDLGHPIYPACSPIRARGA